MLCISSCSLLWMISSTRSFKSLSPSSESWDKGKVTPISKDIFLFWFPTATLFEFQIQCFCFYHLFVFFHCSKQNAFDKSSGIERKKEDIILQNLMGGKYIYGPPNFIYARKKDVKCATTPSKWVMMYMNRASCISSYKKSRK